MQIDFKEEGRALVVAPRGPDLDAHAAVALRDQVIGRIEKGHDRIVLDLARVDFLDSTGLGAVVTLFKRVGPGGALIVCGVGDMVANVFRLTRMDRVFRMARDVGHALELIGERVPAG